MEYTVVEARKVVTFDELSERSKERVVRFLSGLDFQQFMGYQKEFEVEHWFHTQVDMQWDFSYSKGSGLNIYGTFLLEELANFADGCWDEKLESEDFTVQPNRLGTYSVWWSEVEGLAERIEDCGIGADEARETAERICTAMEGLCRKLYKNGESQLEWYWKPEAHEGELYYQDGGWFGLLDDCKVDGDKITVLSA